MKPKVWLVENKHKPKGYEDTRGRMDSAAKALVEAAVASGVQIDGFAVSSKATGPVEPVVSRVATGGSTAIAELPEYRYNFETHHAYSYEGEKKVARSLAEVCKSPSCSGSSLVVCRCSAPTIVSRDGRGDVRVYIERKTA